MYTGLWFDLQIEIMLINSILALLNATSHFNNAQGLTRKCPGQSHHQKIIENYDCYLNKNIEQ